MKVLVAGGAGYIGAHVVRALADRGHEPVILDDLRGGATKDRVGRFAWENVALEDAPRVAEVFRRTRPDAVIHLAGYHSVPGSVADPDRYWNNNVVAGGGLLAACRETPVRSFVFSSSAAVYGNPERVPIPESAPLRPSHPYGETKLAFEQQLHAAAPTHGFRSVALRYFNAAGAVEAWGVGECHDPEEHLIPRVIRALRAGQPVPVYGTDYPTPDGTCIRDYIHVADLAEVHVRVTELESAAGAAAAVPSGTSLNVGTGRGHSVREVIAQISKAMGKPAQISELPHRPGDPAELVADPSALTKALGWTPSHSTMEEIVASAVAWEMRAGR